jgi:hypothetical protein
VKLTGQMDVYCILCTSVVDPDSGSALILHSWIRIRTRNAIPDPGPWKLTKIYTKKPVFLVYHARPAIMTLGKVGWCEDFNVVLIKI